MNFCAGVGRALGRVEKAKEASWSTSCLTRIRQRKVGRVLVESKQGSRISHQSKLER